ncbi:MAG: orotate phosphoribosyltransferase [Candidatus Sumerlaeaceae bacterium]
MTSSSSSIAVPAEDSLAVCSNAGALLNGHFQLSSGLHSSQYFQCAKLLEDPKTGELVTRALAPICARWKPHTVLSPALGAILFGYELSRALGCRNIFSERPAGKFELRRGFELVPGERVVLAENVVTTGGSVLEVAQLVRDLGAEVVGYAVIVDRSGGKFAPPEPVAAYASFTAEAYPPSQCPFCASGSPLNKPGSRQFLAP